MVRIPILQDPAQLQTGNRTLRTPDLPAVTNAGIAKGLADVGAVVMDISEKAKRANDVTNLTNASIEMQKAQLEFATFQQETPDETKWLPKWKEINSRLEGQFSQMPMTPDARAQLQNRLTTWSTNGTIQVQASAFKQTGQRMEQSIDNAINSKNYDAARQAVKDGAASNLFLPEVAQAKMLSIDNAEKDERWNTYLLQRERLADPKTRTPQTLFELEKALDAAQRSMKPEAYQLEVDNLNDMKEEAFVYSEIEKNPERVIEMMDNPDYAPNLKAPQQRERIKNQALARIEELQMQEQRAVMNGILNGSIQNMKQAETLMPRSDDVVKAKIQSVFDKKPPTQYEASILKRALEKAVDEFDPTNDPNDEKTFQIVDTINRLNLYDEKLTSTLREKFFKKQQQRTPPSPIESEIANHKKFLDYVYEPKIKALMDNDGNVPVDKQQEFRDLLSIRDQLATEFERMVDAGEIKTREQARNASVRMLAEPYANEVMDYWRYRPLEVSPEEAARIEKQKLSK